MQSNKFKVRIKIDACAIHEEDYNKVVEVSDDYNEEKYTIHNTPYIWIYKIDCTIVPNRNLIGGKLI